MKIFFICKTGHHTSLVAANYYLEKSKTDFTSINIKNMSGFNDIKRNTVGKPYYVGSDSFNNSVYSIGVSSTPEIFTRVIGDYLNIIGEKPENWETLDLTKYISFYTKVGILLHFFGLDFLAMPLFRAGIKKESPFIKSLVNELKSNIKNFKTASSNIEVLG